MFPRTLEELARAPYTRAGTETDRWLAGLVLCGTIVLLITAVVGLGLFTVGGAELVKTFGEDLAKQLLTH